MDSILSTLLLLPIVGAVMILFLPNDSPQVIKCSALIISCATFLLSLFLWIGFDNSSAEFQYVEHFHWLPGTNMNCCLGIDGISLFFILLSTFLVPVCLLVGWSSIQNYIKE
jgi:NADH-quinone oxidoreductase subunit M